MSGVNHMLHSSLPSCSTHPNHYKLWCADGEQPSKHCAFMSVRAANSSSTELSCHVCDGKGSEPEQALYAVADAEELIELYAVEACSIVKAGCVEVCDTIQVYPSRKRWDLTVVTPHGLLVEVMGQGHRSRLVTKLNNTDDSISTRQRKDFAYADAAIKQGWSVLWLWVENDDPSCRRIAKKWAAQLREALMYVVDQGKPRLFNT